MLGVFIRDLYDSKGAILYCKSQTEVIKKELFRYLISLLLETENFDYTDELLNLIQFNLQEFEPSQLLLQLPTTWSFALFASFLKAYNTKTRFQLTKKQIQFNLIKWKQTKVCYC